MAVYNHASCSTRFGIGIGSYAGGADDDGVVGKIQQIGTRKAESEMTNVVSHRKLYADYRLKEARRGIISAWHEIVMHRMYIDATWIYSPVST